MKDNHEGNEFNISVVILSRNRSEELKENLLRLLMPGVPADEIIVVDNASTDGTRGILARIAAAYPKLHVLSLEKNLGVAGGRNAGFRIAKRKYVVSLDDDASIVPADLARIPGLFDDYPEAGILSFRIIHPRTGRCQNNHGPVPRLVANHHGSGFAVRRAVFEDVGFIDEKCVFGAEELDLCIKAHSAGYITIYIPELVILHNNNLTAPTKNIMRRKLRVYNYVRTNYKFFPEATALLFSFRYTLRHVISALRLFNLTQTIELLPEALRGRRDGLLDHRTIFPDTLRFYRTTDLQPDFGSVSLTKSLRKLLRQSWLGS